MTLTEFLLARIAEDEAVADRAVIIRTPNGFAWTAPPPEHGALILSGHRLLAECEAKRRIVELHRASEDHGAGYVPYCVGCWEAGGEDGAPGFPCPTLRLLALPYADHPDYDEAWRP